MFRGYLALDKILTLLWQKCYVFGKLFPVLNDQIFKINLAIWSHCERMRGRRRLVEWWEGGRGIFPAPDGQLHSIKRRLKYTEGNLFTCLWSGIRTSSKVLAFSRLDSHLSKKVFFSAPSKHFARHGFWFYLVPISWYIPISWYLPIS